MKQKHPDFLSPMEDARLERPTAERVNRFALDQAIRAKGYTIKELPDKGEPTWERNGVTFTQRDVILRHKSIRDAMHSDVSILDPEEESDNEDADEIAEGLFEDEEPDHGEKPV
jgi:hypothetical protein